MLDNLYNKQILGFAANIPLIGHLDAPDATAKAHSRLCGSTVTAELNVKDGVVTAFAHDVKACALGQASASIMARHVIGATTQELHEIQCRMTAMLKEGGPADFAGRWADLNVLEPVREFKSRHASTLLTFNAVVEALNSIEAETPAAASCC